MKTRVKFIIVFIVILIFLAGVLCQLLVPYFDAPYKEKLKTQRAENIAKKLAAVYMLSYNDNKQITLKQMSNYAKNEKVPPINSSGKIKYLYRKLPPVSDKDMIIICFLEENQKRFGIQFDGNLISFDMKSKIDLNNFEYYPNNWP